MRIVAYHSSDSARMLRSMLHCGISYANNSDQRNGRTRLPVLVNYGCDMSPNSQLLKRYDIAKLSGGKNILNATAANAHSKLATFKMLEGIVPTMEWSLEPIKGHPFFSRKDGLSRGEGIHSFDSIKEWEALENKPEYDFFVRYFDPENEYRVHVLHNRFLDTTQFMFYKKEINRAVKIQNGANTRFQIYDTDGSVARTQRIALMSEMALLAVRTLGLDFGAVDIIEVAKRDFRVLEVNTAPGFDETNLYTPRIYANFFENYKEV